MVIMSIAKRPRTIIRNRSSESTGHYTNYANGKGKANKPKNIGDWKKQITRLMNDFGISRSKINAVIDTVESSATGDENDQVLYNRAHNMFYAIIKN